MSDNIKDILSCTGKVFINTFLFLFACFLGGLIYLSFLSKDLPSLEELQQWNPEEVTKIMSFDMEMEDYQEDMHVVTLDLYQIQVLAFQISMFHLFLELLI